MGAPLASNDFSNWIFIFYESNPSAEKVSFYLSYCMLMPYSWWVTCLNLLLILSTFSLRLLFFLIPFTKKLLRKRLRSRRLFRQLWIWLWLLLVLRILCFHCAVCLYFYHTTCLYEICVAKFTTAAATKSKEKVEVILFFRWRKNPWSKFIWISSYGRRNSK